jgi:hypothetical protein
MTPLLLAATLLGFPLPQDFKGEPPAGAKKLVLPFSFERLERFYKEQLGAAEGVTVRAEKADDGARRLVVTSKRKVGDSWARAVITEGENHCTLEVQALLKGAEQEVKGSGKPEVQVLLQRSGHAKELADSIEHAPR